MKSLLVLTGVLARRNRVTLVAWSISLILLVAVTIPSYAAAYPSLADRGPLVAQMRDTVATKVLYGPLPTPGTLGQLAQWETGTYLILLAAMLGILLGVRLGRAEEQQGATEVVRATGVGRPAPVTSAVLVLAGTFAAIGAGTFAVLAWQARTTTEVSLAGAWRLGAVVALVGLGFGLSTLCLGQVLPTASAVRAAAWLFLGFDFVLRVLADLAPAPAFRWLTWFGLRDLVGPFSHDRTMPLVLAGALVVALGLLTVCLNGRRELGAGLVPPRRSSGRPARVRSPLALAWRLGSFGYLGWVGGTVALAALFGGMSHGLISVAATDTATSEMFGRLSGQTDPVAQYFGFSAVFISMVPIVHGVGHVLAVRSAERSALLDVELATGVPRWRPLAAQAVLSAAQATGLLVLAGLVQSGVAVLVGADADVRKWALWTVMTSVPGTLAAVAITALLVGLCPRLARLAWLVVAWSAFATLLGGLVSLPGWAQHASLLVVQLEQVTGPIRDALEWGTVGILVGLALLTAAAGVVAMSRRDVTTG